MMFYSVFKMYYYILLKEKLRQKITTSINFGLAVSSVVSPGRLESPSTSKQHP